MEDWSGIQRKHRKNITQKRIRAAKTDANTKTNKTDIETFVSEQLSRTR